MMQVDCGPLLATAIFNYYFLHSIFIIRNNFSFNFSFFSSQFSGQIILMNKCFMHIRSICFFRSASIFHIHTLLKSVMDVGKLCQIFRLKVLFNCSNLFLIAVFGKFGNFSSKYIALYFNR